MCAWASSITSFDGDRLWRRRRCCPKSFEHLTVWSQQTWKESQKVSVFALQIKKEIRVPSRWVTGCKFLSELLTLLYIHFLNYWHADFFSFFFFKPRVRSDLGQQIFTPVSVCLSFLPTWAPCAEKQVSFESVCMFGHTACRQAQPFKSSKLWLMCFWFPEK